MPSMGMWVSELEIDSEYRSKYTVFPRLRGQVPRPQQQQRCSRVRTRGHLELNIMVLDISQLRHYGYRCIHLAGDGFILDRLLRSQRTINITPLNGHDAEWHVSCHAHDPLGPKASSQRHHVLSC